ncbi:hypothetical protein GCM10022397_07500 [Flavivirga jejuensis]
MIFFWKVNSIEYPLEEIEKANKTKYHYHAANLIQNRVCHETENEIRILHIYYNSTF